MISDKKWLFTFTGLSIMAGVGISLMTWYIDPYMHYRSPRLDSYNYILSNERSQNDGMTKHLDYDAIITGTSMAENFRTSEADRIFGVRFIKVPYSGGSFKEINDNLKTALRTHPHTKIIIRSLDRYNFNQPVTEMRNDMGHFPTYLYDTNPLDDVEYLFNKDAVYHQDLPMLWGKWKKGEHGMTSFDDYANWMGSYTFGQRAVFPVLSDVKPPKEPTHLTQEERKTIRDNVKANITDLADAYPETQFYYFLPPYSVAYYYGLKQSHMLEKQVEIEKLAASLIIPHKNIHLFAWNRFDLLDDLNNYKDAIHYGEWINSWMLMEMRKGEGRLTGQNYEAFFEEALRHYDSFAYGALLKQEDYEADYYAAALLNQEIAGTEPVQVDGNLIEPSELKSCQKAFGLFQDSDGYVVTGAAVKGKREDKQFARAVYEGDYQGMRFTVDASPYRTLVFYGKRTAGLVYPDIYVYDRKGKLLRRYQPKKPAEDHEWHPYAVNLAGIYDKVVVVLGVEAKDQVNAREVEYQFAGIMLY